MNPILKNALAIIVATVAMMAANMAVLMACSIVVPDLAQVNLHALAGLELLYFLPPFLAHSLGTLVGAVIATKMATSEKCGAAITVGAIHLAGGVAATFMIDAPTWYDLIDVSLAYIPVAWIGWKLAK